MQKITSEITGEKLDIKTHFDKNVEWMLGPKDESEKNFDSKKDEISHAIFRRHELPIADYLMSFKDDLLTDFLNVWFSFENFEKKGPTVGAKDYTSSEIVTTKARLFDSTKDETELLTKRDSWKTTGLKYTIPDEHYADNMDLRIRQKFFPTADKLLNEYGDDCPICTYSYISPQSQIHRHTGIENRSGEFIRIHMPLIVPEGDIFFEVNDEEVTWDDIFAFDNQLVHSAHNLTDKGRLIFIIDMRRSRAGLPPGQPYNKARQRAATSFYIRKPKV